MSTLTHTFRNLPLHQKLTVIAMVTSGSTLLIAILVLAVHDLTTFRNNLEADVAASASLGGQNSTAAISFQDRAAAMQNLTALRDKPNIRAACIYDQSGMLFASYTPARATCPEPPD